MKCPKCDYVSFDYNQSCPRCNKDIGVEQKKLNLPGYEPAQPFFLASLIRGAVNGTAGFDGTLRMRQGAAVSVEESPTMEDGFEVGAEDLSEDEADLSELEADGGEKEIQIGEDALNLNLEEEIQELEEPDVVRTGEEETPFTISEPLEEGEDLSLNLDLEEDEPLGLEDQSGEEGAVVGFSDEGDDSDFSLELADLAEEMEDQTDKNDLESLDEMNDDDLFDMGGLNLDEDAPQEGPLFTESEMVTMELEANNEDSDNDLEDLDFELDLEDAEKESA